MPTAGRNTASAIRDEAARQFFEFGYHGTSLRGIASGIGLKVGSLYNHITSKEDLLFQVMGSIMDSLMEDQEKVLERQYPDSVERLRAFLDCHLRFHATRAREVSIGNKELRSLPDDARGEMIAKRHAYEDLLEQLITDAGRDGLAQVLDPRVHVYSLVGQATHLASWYRTDGRIGLDELVSLYTKLGLRELRVADADERVDRAAGRD